MANADLRWGEEPGLLRESNVVTRVFIREEDLRTFFYLRRTREISPVGGGPLKSSCLALKLEEHSCKSRSKGPPVEAVAKVRKLIFLRVSNNEACDPFQIS